MRSKGPNGRQNSKRDPTEGFINKRYNFIVMTKKSVEEKEQTVLGVLIIV